MPDASTLDAATLQTVMADAHRRLATTFGEHFPEWTLPAFELPTSIPPRRQWQAVNDYWLARKQGVLALKLKELGALPADQRPVRGPHSTASRPKSKPSCPTSKLKYGLSRKPKPSGARPWMSPCRGWCAGAGAPIR